METVTKESIKQFFNKNIALFFCIITAIISVTICSKSSPLYPFNNWMDANCYFTVGKSIFKGLVPYRDLVEQKGPFIYFVHAFASLISYRTFLGVYFIELIGSFFLFYFSNKTLKLFCGEKSYLIIPFFALIIYTSTAFRHGDSAEELCFPFIAYLIYIAFRTIQTNTNINNKEFFFIGITSSCVFWTKFSLCGIYIGWYIPFFISVIIHKKYKYLLNSIIFICSGLIIGTLPYILYFGLNHSLEDLFSVYIYNNIFIYTGSKKENISFLVSVKNLIQNLLNGVQDFKDYFSKGFILVIVGGLYCFFRKWLIQLLYTICMFSSAFFFIYFGAHHYPYYSLGIAPLLCLGLIPFFNIISEQNQIYNRLSKKSYFIYVIIFMLFIYCTDNRELLKFKKDELPQYRFAKIISKTPDAKLLNYGELDIGLYTTTGILPNCKYFCKLNISLPEMYKTQNLYIEKGLCDYIVTYSDDIDHISKLNADKNNFYELIDNTNFKYEGKNLKYSLYKLKK